MGQNMRTVLWVIILILEIWATWPVIQRNKGKIFIFYTQISNALCTLSVAAGLITGGAAWTVPLRYLATVMLGMTCLVTVGILVPMGGDPKFLLFSRHGFPHHLMCPVLSLVSYIFFEQHASAAMIALPSAVTLVYGIIMLILNGMEKVDGPYPFFRVRHQSALATLVWMTALMIAVTGIGALIWLAA